MLVGAIGWWFSLSNAQAQQPPTHVFKGTASVDGNPAPNGTTVSAWIDGNGVAKTTVQGGTYSLSVQQTPGQSYAGKGVIYRVGGVQTGEIRKWQQGGATVANLNAYTQGAGLPARFIQECVKHALGRLPSSREDMTAQELNLANELCPALKGRMGALNPAGGGGGGGGGSGDGSLQDALACVAKVLGRMPLGPQDMTGEERLRVFQQCPALINNMDELMAMDRTGGLPGFQPDPSEQELRQVEEEIRQLEREGPREIQQELDRLDRDRSELERQLYDDLQRQLNSLEQERFDVERQRELELRNVDPRRHREVETKFQRLISSKERERFEVERRTQIQIGQQLGNLERERQDRERQLWDEYQRVFNNLEQRRFGLENEMERHRFEEERLRREQDDRQRFAREREQEEIRFRQQEELDRQRIEQERLRMEQERQREEELFRRQEELDRQRFAEELRRQQERQRQDPNIQQGSNRSGTGGGDDGQKKSGGGLPTRGFFTNSVSGSISDVDKFMDPTTLAVFGILLTLLATSLSLVKGN
ncbi:MAG: hypothetical protein BZY88_17820 [SAR202 cluster bacterium Io17-Chloro-G9]|nr:MAG: hypothetical protein BZY88_17820 [SAR202 cluster bacterium Io17-Chloro-G9]